MPRYEYHCPANGVFLETSHSIHRTIATWGELCEAAGREPGATDPATPVERVLHGGVLMVDKPKAQGGHCCGDSGCSGH